MDKDVVPSKIITKGKNQVTRIYAQHPQRSGGTIKIAGPSFHDP